MRKILIGAFVVLVCVSGFLLFKSNNKVTDAKKFSLEYHNVTDDNVFVYRDVDDIIKIMKHGTGVVYLGFPECDWCQAYVRYLNEVALEVGIDKIYYYNIFESRKNNNDEYREIVSLLDGYLQYDDEGNSRVYVPNVSFHVNGKIVGNDYETSLDTHGLGDPSLYWTEVEVKELKNNLKKYMEVVRDSKTFCTDCNK